jgi:toxin ParE1/3/4
VKIRWTRQANADLDSAYEFVAAHNPTAAANLIHRIEQTIGILAQNPAAGRKGRIGGTREFAIAGTPFVIPYRIRGQVIDILALIHGSRKWPKSL